MKIPTARRLHEVLDYDQLTGVFRFRVLTDPGTSGKTIGAQ